MRTKREITHWSSVLITLVLCLMKIERRESEYTNAKNQDCHNALPEQ